MKEEFIHIVIIDDSSNDAETVTNMLRNAGHALRAIKVEDDEDLRKAMSEHPCDMVLSKPEIPFFSALDALGVIEKMEVDLPLLVIADDAAEARISECLKSGARDAVYIARPERLEHAVLRELDDLRRRRRHRECEELLNEANERAQSLVESSRDAIAYVHEGMHIYANQSYLNMFGYSDFAELEGLPIMDMIAVDDQGHFKEFLRSYIKGRAKEDRIALHGHKSDGRTFDVTMEFSPATYEGEICTQIVIRDQSISKELEKKLDDLSKQDLLTGVYNRQYFLQELKEVVGKPGRQGAVVYLRPDNFKELRQHIGIAASDMVLTDIATLVNNHLEKKEDLVARFESNIFTVILHDLDKTRAEKATRKILDSIAAHVADAGGQSVTTTCSAGVTFYNEAIHSPQEVITRAERAYNHAAMAGHGRLHVYSPAGEEITDRERLAEWEKRLKHALRDNAFRLLYQPVISLHGGGNENYEVLLRMIEPEGKDVEPGEFIPAAEELGLMAVIDRWVLANAVKVLAERRRAGNKTNFFVKVSAGSLKDERLLPWLRDLLRAARLESNTLTLEVSESIASNNIRGLKVLIEGLRQLHIALALDHVGLAPNFANLLKHCNAQFVKIDGSLISAINRDATAKGRIQLITATAKETDKRIIAEFVEDAQTLAALWSSGVDFIQGHFLQPPASEMTYDFSAAG